MPRRKRPKPLRMDNPKDRAEIRRILREDPAMEPARRIALQLRRDAAAAMHPDPWLGGAAREGGLAR